MTTRKKRKNKVLSKTGVLFISIIVLLNTFSVGYGSWADNLNIQNMVSSAKVDAIFSKCEVTEENSEGRLIKIIEENNPKKIHFVIDEGYEGYSVTLNYEVKNIGTLPISLKVVEDEKTEHKKEYRENQDKNNKDEKRLPIEISASEPLGLIECGENGKEGKLKITLGKVEEKHKEEGKDKDNNKFSYVLSSGYGPWKEELEIFGEINISENGKENKGGEQNSCQGSLGQGNPIMKDENQNQEQENQNIDENQNKGQENQNIKEEVKEDIKEEVKEEDIKKEEVKEEIKEEIKENVKEEVKEKNLKPEEVKSNTHSENQNAEKESIPLKTEIPIVEQEKPNTENKITTP